MQRTVQSCDGQDWTVARQELDFVPSQSQNFHDQGERFGRVNRELKGTSVMTVTAGKTAFVFAGGGSLGAIQVGMLRALLSSGLHPDFVVGASVGAINASYFASAPNAEGVASLERIWSGLRRADIFPFSLASAFGLLRHPDNIINPSRLRRLIETHLSYARLEEAAIPLHVVATDLQGLSVCLSSGPAVEAILASTAIPGVFPPVYIDGRAANGRRNRGQYAHPDRSRTRSVTNHRVADRLCLRAERIAKRGGGQGPACNHVDDNMAAQA